MEIIRWQDDYYSSQEMMKFVSGQVEPNRDIMLECVDDAPLKMLMSERYAQASNIRIIILNSQYVPVFSYIGSLIRERDACVEHYMLVDDDTARTIRGVNSLLGIVYEPSYNGYICMSDTRSRHRGLMMADMMHVAYDTPDGRHLEDMVVFDRDDHAYVHSAAGNGMLHRVLAIPREKFVPIKRTYFERTAMEDYVQFSQDYARLEYNRTIYKIKPDFGVAYVPVDILADAVREGLMFQKNNMENVLDALVRIYEKRVQNTYEKRRATHAIMKRSALWKFVRSGKTSDHL